ncbi:sugar phosphate isomerase/epimerase family protein [Lichenifustis flavocetrariae]|uniref:Sugar phosphate isomerase/epimerase n=1 Tax=Lichenifustis flavocetrariae TaxID=2949735 RepID=A0AA42CIL6_9HYPH|nr:sugar phosphate isomerase/epimerase family protein [Lichenifustis flavocetrariae]MCW6507006.1 sugar phosphate isomerase/epimerase [Lichenifustis flavocetrariae]
MRLGIFAKTFPGTDAASVLAAVRDAGYGCTQFNMACVGLPAMPEAVEPGVIEAIAQASRDTGVTLSALSATYNMIHPDTSVRQTGLHRLRVILDTARALGIPLVTLCTGTRDPDDQWRHHPDNAAPEAWFDLCREMEKALAMAEAEGIDLCIEPEQANVVTSALDARRLIDDMGSQRLRIVVDPANLFEQATPDEARRIVAEAVAIADGAIAMAHAKDRAHDGRFVTAGTGVVDFPDFLDRLWAEGFDGPVVTHGLAATEAAGVAAYLKELGLR